MPSSFQKARKQITKKRAGGIPALHEKSRDSMRLHNASVRDQRLEKLAAARSKREQPIVDRVNFFRERLEENGGEALEIGAIQELITWFIEQYEEEYDALKKARRQGRPGSAREDLLKLKISALQTEYQKGFTLPDLTTKEGIEVMERWEGSWTTVTAVPWIKVTKTGQMRQTEFPSKGLN